jgi:hypothetical protein
MVTHSLASKAIINKETMAIPTKREPRSNKAPGWLMWQEVFGPSGTTATLYTVQHTPYRCYTYTLYTTPYHSTRLYFDLGSTRPSPTSENQMAMADKSIIR